MERKLLVVLLIATFFIGACKDKKLPPAEWKRSTLSNLGLSVETPFVFKEKSIEDQLTPDVRKLVKEMHSFFEEQGENFYGATAAEYTAEVTVSVEGAINGAIQEMASKAKGTVENRKDEVKMINGNQANCTTATIARTDKDKMELQMVVLTKGQCIYQVMGLYRPDKDDVRKTAKRMIASIELKP